MSATLKKNYDPQSLEAKWYAFWLERECFTARAESGKPAYSIVIPPPNVTGILHMGHVLNNTIQDILARKARMEGFEVLWLPGTDHAGIATQVVVEKQLKREEHKTRHDLGRQRFVERVWKWKERHGVIIFEQLKRLGCSCDWTRERFTMDAEYSRTVAEVFVDLYNMGLIYKGKRMVNWCPVSHTALSDEEVVMKPQNSVLYYFQVPVADDPERVLTIATTRPETIPGDTGVAVNPRDPRYQDLIGRHVLRPLPAELPESEKRIPIVADDSVDFEFGTGILKVTPAHDTVDFEIGTRHGLEPVEVIDFDGRMNAKAGRDLVGLDRDEARQVAARKLRELGRMEKEEPYPNNVGFSERADVPIEPRLSEQWFLKYPSVEAAREVVAKGELQFFPERWAKVYHHWLDQLRDWCISRQLWWGHQIPVWYKDGEMKCQLDTPGEGWVQDPDVLDTWFSSWLWPWATMDEATRKKFYPTTVLVTAPEILFFWVARMIMAGFEYTGEKPFRDVYLTGIVRDKKGRKMSKSLGNSPDPLDLIGQYSADALRFGVMRSAPLGQDLLFDEKHVELGRNFCTKLWNACRFRQMQAGPAEGEIDPALLTSEDKWIFLKLDRAIREITSAFEAYRFNEAVQTLYRFFWSEFCDWYIEACKPALGGDGVRLRENVLAVIDFVLSHTLRLFHPFLPFVTEELWQGMGYANDLPAEQGGVTIMNARWPKPLDAEFMAHYRVDESDEAVVEARHDLITQGRNLRQQFNLPSNRKLRYVLKPAGPVSGHETEVIRSLLNADPLEIDPAFPASQTAPAVNSPYGELCLPLEGLIDFDTERRRLQKELAKIEKELAKVRNKLDNPEFRAKVPPPVLQQQEERFAEWQAKKNKAEVSLHALES